MVELTDFSRSVLTWFLAPGLIYKGAYLRASLGYGGAHTILDTPLKFDPMLAESKPSDLLVPE